MMPAMICRFLPSRGRLILLLLAAFLLVAMAGCSLPQTAGPASSGPGPTVSASSVQQQLAQLAAGAQISPTESAALQPSSTPQSGPTRADLQPSPTRTKRPTAAASTPRPTRRPSATPAQRPSPSARATRTPSDGLPTISEAKLPPEARRTIALIRQGGPFPYDKDGATFGNREGLLPKRPSGYYQEYTVITPGSPDRGARRIIAGDGGELYYTDDHYGSFKRVVP